MPSVICENVAQVVAGYLSGGEPCENVYHVHSATPWSIVKLQDLLNTFADWETTFASLQRSEGASLIRLTATDLTSLTSPRQDQVLVTPIAGQVVTPVLPSNVTMAVKADIGERGRGRNGRSFWVGLGEDMVVNNLVDIVIAGNITTALNELITAISTAEPDQDLGIIHTVVGGVAIEPAIFSIIAGWVITDPSVDSQRDRLPFHKAHKHAHIVP